MMDDPGGSARVNERSPLVQGMIEAGFSRAQAERALSATQAQTLADVPRAINWLLKEDLARNKNETSYVRVVHTFDQMDLDGCELPPTSIACPLPCDG